MTLKAKQWLQKVTKRFNQLRSQKKNKVIATCESYQSIKDKPQVTKSIMFTLSPRDNTFHSYILPLTQFEIYWYKDTIRMILPCPDSIKKKIPQGLCAKGGFTMTDDAKIEFCTDWSDCGCFRLVHKFHNGTIAHTDTGITITLPKDKYGKDMWMPDRVRWDLKGLKQ